MPVDASINEVSDLGLYSRGLSDFCVSMVNNMKSLETILMQKMYVLGQKKKEMEAMAEAASLEYHQCQKALANCGSRDVEERKRLLTELSSLEHKNYSAQSALSVVSLKYNTARGTILYMVDKTNKLKTDITFDIDKGRHFLKNVAEHLELYNNQKK